jgi:hypothetical protein
MNSLFHLRGSDILRGHTAHPVFVKRRTVSAREE